MAQTAVLLIDPYNDFLHETGKAYSLVAESLQDTDAIRHLKEVVKTARANKIPIFYCLHQQTNQYSYLKWERLSTSQERIAAVKTFEEGSFGAQIFEGLEPDLASGDVIVSKHWNSSSFANTDLDFQLKKRGVKKVVIAGMIANTCVESTARYAYELDYDITMLSDATAGFGTTERKDAAVKLIWPLFADKVFTVEEWSNILKGE